MERRDLLRLRFMAANGSRRDTCASRPHPRAVMEKNFLLVVNIKRRNELRVETGTGDGDT